MSIDEARKNYYNIASTNLAFLSNEKLIALLANARPLHEGIGGTSALIPIEGTQIFIKKIPLTNIELLPSNIRSTANIFELPLHYQYGVGSAGFGAWRELTAEIINATLEWSGITNKNFNTELFVKMLSAYQAAGGKINQNHLQAVFFGVLGNWINWMMIAPITGSKKIEMNCDLSLPTVNSALKNFIITECCKINTWAFSK